MAWHVERIKILTRNGFGFDRRTAPAVWLHRKWLAAQMIAADWHEDPKVCNLRWESSSAYRLQAMAQFGKTQDAIATTEAVVKGGDPHIYALAAGSVKGDAVLADRYATRAVALLRRAAVAGDVDGQRLLTDPDFDALRGRKDFIDFLWDLANAH